MSPKTPYQLGYESAGFDAECPFGEFDEDGANRGAYEAWHEGREDAEEKMSDEFAQYCDRSMRDLYE